MDETLARLLHRLLNNLRDLLIEIATITEQKVLNDASEELRDLWVRDGELLPIYEPCFRSFRDQGYIHPAQLSGRDLADYALCLLDEDYVLYQRYRDCASKFFPDRIIPPDGSCDGLIEAGKFIWSSDNWAPNLALYFPDLSPLPMWDGIDPFDPTQFTDEWQPGVWLPIFDLDLLPYLPLNDITNPPRGSQETPNASRVALAQATIDIWQAFGLDEFNDPAYLAAWINRYEHGGAIDYDDDAPDYMSQVIYATYMQADDSQYGYDQLPLFMSGWSVTLFMQRTEGDTTVDARTFEFFERLLTPLSEDDLEKFGNSELWETMPDLNELGIDLSATRTFGSTEFDNDSLRRAFHTDTSRYVRAFPDGAYNPEQTYVYVMTPCQFNSAHASKDAGQLLELNC